MKVSYLVSICALLVIRNEAELLSVEPLRIIHLSQTVSDIIMKYYRTHSNTIVFYRAAENEETFQRQSDIVSEVLWRIGTRQSVIIESAGYVRNFTVDDRRRLNVFFLDTYISYKHLAKQLYHITNESSGRCITVLTEPKHPDELAHELQMVINISWDAYYSNSVMLPMPYPTVPGQPGAVPIYTFFPFTHGHCEKPFPALMTTIEPGHQLANEAVDLFPPKFQNMHGCPLRVSTFQNEPYVMINPQKVGAYQLSGIDGYLIRVLSQRMRFSVIVKLEKDRGLIFPNGTGTGSLGEVKGGKVNMTIGNYGLSKGRSLFLRPSTCIYFTALCLALSPGHSYTSLEKLFLPFRSFAWYLLSATFSLAVILILMLRRAPVRQRDFIMGPNNRSPICNMIAVCFGGGIQLSLRRNFARYILVMWILMMLVLRNMYQAYLFVLLQKRMLHPIPTTFQGLIAANYTFYAEEAAASFLQEALTNKRGFQPYFGQYQTLVASRPNSSIKVAYVMSSTVIDYYNRQNYRQGFRVERSKTRIMLVPIVFYLQPLSCIEEPINELINWMVSSGIIEYWASTLHTPLGYGGHEDEQHEPQRMNMHQLLGTFWICAGMLGMAGLVFFAELLSQRVAMIRGIFEYICFDR